MGQAGSAAPEALRPGMQEGPGHSLWESPACFPCSKCASGTVSRAEEALRPGVRQLAAQTAHRRRSSLHTSEPDLRSADAAVALAQRLRGGKTPGIVRHRGSTLSVSRARRERSRRSDTQPDSCM